MGGWTPTFRVGWQKVGDKRQFFQSYFPVFMCFHIQSRRCFGHFNGNFPSECRKRLKFQNFKALGPRAIQTQPPMPSTDIFAQMSAGQFSSETNANLCDLCPTGASKTTTMKALKAIAGGVATCMKSSQGNKHAACDAFLIVFRSVCSLNDGDVLKPVDFLKVSYNCLQSCLVIQRWEDARFVLSTLIDYSVSHKEIKSYDICMSALVSYATFCNQTTGDEQREDAVGGLMLLLDTSRLLECELSTKERDTIYRVLFKVAALLKKEKYAKLALDVRILALNVQSNGASQEASSNICEQAYKVSATFLRDTKGQNIEDWLSAMENLCLPSNGGADWTKLVGHVISTTLNAPLSHARATPWLALLSESESCTTAERFTLELLQMAVDARETSLPTVAWKLHERLLAGEDEERTDILKQLLTSSIICLRQLNTINEGDNDQVQETLILGMASLAVIETEKVKAAEYMLYAWKYGLRNFEGFQLFFVRWAPMLEFPAATSLCLQATNLLVKNGSFADAFSLTEAVCYQLTSISQSVAHSADCLMWLVPFWQSLQAYPKELQAFITENSTLLESLQSKQASCTTFLWVWIYSYILGTTHLSTINEEVLAIFEVFVSLLEEQSSVEIGACCRLRFQLYQGTAVSDLEDAFPVPSLQKMYEYLENPKPLPKRKATKQKGKDEKRFFPAVIENEDRLMHLEICFAVRQVVCMAWILQDFNILVDAHSYFADLSEAQQLFVSTAAIIQKTPTGDLNPCMQVFMARHTLEVSQNSELKESSSMHDLCTAEIMRLRGDTLSAYELVQKRVRALLRQLSQTYGVCANWEDLALTLTFVEKYFHCAHAIGYTQVAIHTALSMLQVLHTVPHLGAKSPWFSRILHPILEAVQHAQHSTDIWSAPLILPDQQDLWATLCAERTISHTVKPSETWPLLLTAPSQTLERIPQSLWLQACNAVPTEDNALEVLRLGIQSGHSLCMVDAARHLLSQVEEDHQDAKDAMPFFLLCQIHGILFRMQRLEAIKVVQQEAHETPTSRVSRCIIPETPAIASLKRSDHDDCEGVPDIPDIPEKELDGVFMNLERAFERELQLHDSEPSKVASPSASADMWFNESSLLSLGWKDAGNAGSDAAWLRNQLGQTNQLLGTYGGRKEMQHRALIVLTRVEDTCTILSMHGEVMRPSYQPLCSVAELAKLCLQVNEAVELVAEAGALAPNAQTDDYSQEVQEMRTNYWNLVQKADAIVGGVESTLRRLVQPVMESLRSQHQKKAQPRKRGTASSEEILDLHISLVVEGEWCKLPWESAFSGQVRSGGSAVAGMQVARLPTPLLFFAQSQRNTAVDLSSLIYVVDPKGNLPQTAQRIGSLCQAISSWRGTLSQPPSKDALYAFAKACPDIFLFAGHGNGGKMTSSLAQHCQQGLPLKVVLLMGCASAALHAAGQSLEPLGMPTDLLIAGCRTIAGCQWPVTDGDLDRLTLSMLQQWGLGSVLSQALGKGRQSCRLSHFVGGGTILYGDSLQQSAEVPLEMSQSSLWQKSDQTTVPSIPEMQRANVAMSATAAAVATPLTASSSTLGGTSHKKGASTTRRRSSRLQPRM
jgi:hypothetical protein